MASVLFTHIFRSVRFSVDRLVIPCCVCLGASGCGRLQFTELLKIPVATPLEAVIEFHTRAGARTPADIVDGPESDSDK